MDVSRSRVVDNKDDELEYLYDEIPFATRIDL